MTEATACFRPDTEFAEHFDRARDRWSRALASPELQQIAHALEAAGISVDECVREAATITEFPPTRQRLATIREMIARPAVGVRQGAFERFILAHAVLRYERGLQSAPVSPVAKRLTCVSLARFADDATAVDISENRFAALCKMATLRRFAAGQFDWERSGLARSLLHRIRPVTALIRLLSMIAFEWRAFSPVFDVHMRIAYPVYALRERETLKSYYRMAQSLELQPDVKGLIVSAWLHSPATFAVSPHLGWLNKVFAAHRAVIATTGPAPLDCGVLAQSAERQRAFEEGRFKPTLGFIVWSRRDMLAWAAAHPELGH